MLQQRISNGWNLLHTIQAKIPFFIKQILNMQAYSDSIKLSSVCNRQVLTIKFVFI